MAQIRWNEQFSVTNEFIDNQHKQIISIINDLYESQRKDDQFETMESIFIRLKEYANTHFRDEEKLLAEWQYPNLKEHHEAHQKLINKLLEEQKEFINMKKQYPIRQLLSFIKEWLVDHLYTMDKKYIPYIKQ